MNSLILNKKLIPYVIIAALFIYILMINKKETKQVVIPSAENTFEKIDPVPEVRFDTIYKDSKQKEVLKIVQVENPFNKDLMKKYEAAVKAKDSLLQVTMYKTAITENSYKETFEDSIQTIEVRSLVTGTLKSQTLHYKTKQRTINVSSGRTKPALYLGGFVSFPTKTEFAVQTYGLNLNLVNKKRSLSVGFDNQKNINVGVGLKLF